MTKLTNWADDIAMPLHLALDKAGDDPAARTIEEKWVVVMDACPWLRELVRGPVDESILDSVPPTEGGKPDWMSVTSTNLDAVAKGRTPFGIELLFVRFKNGSVWRYTNVPADIAEAIRDSPSPGGHFAGHVKGHYSGAPVEQLDPRDFSL